MRIILNMPYYRSKVPPDLTTYLNTTNIIKAPVSRSLQTIKFIWSANIATSLFNDSL